jgi:predicted Ser/Thr protein kinase
MSTPAAATCPQCKAPLAPDAPEGLCPACLLKAAARPEPGAGSPADMVDIGDAVAVGQCLPQFEILELLGRGGMGVVYKARQRQLDRLVALKILPPADALSPDFLARFSREARSLAKLTHPNIVAIYDFGESGGIYYFSMEFVEGVNLRQLLATKEVSAEQALAIVPQICDALAYAHEEGVVHRDIKPENILIDRKGRVKIADFGLAKLLQREALDLTLTATGVTLGTMRYMAPEQMEKPETVDHRADIYSLGVVIYEMLTGDVPMGRFALPSQTAGVDARLDQIVLHALEREPSQRYQQVTEVKTDFENLSSIMEKLPRAVREMMGVEYESPRKLFGLPLLHIAFGLDPKTGRRRVARGVIAIGESAVGVLAFGGMARGVFAFGGCAFGLITLGGVAVGLVSLGGMALALLLAIGGMAVGGIAWGGAAIGWLAMGGYALGPYSAGSNGANPIGVAAFKTLAPLIQTIFYGAGVVYLLGFPLMLWARRWAATHPTSAAGALRARATPPPAADMRLERVILGTLCAIGLILFLSFRSYSAMDPAGGWRTAVELGAVDPWLYSSRVEGNRMSSGLNLASWSAFAGYCGLFAGATLLRRVSRATIYAWVAVGVFILALTSLSTISRYTASLSQSPAAAKAAKPSTP